jgi:glucan phosphoethanolaminetransferase (alkaline phosphatase superfamily)
MSRLARVAEHVVVNQVLNNALPLIGKSKVGLGPMALTGLLLLVSDGFLIYAAHMYFLSLFPVYTAAALTGGLCLVIAVLSSSVSYFINLYKRRQQRQMIANLVGTFHDLYETAEEELSEPINENPKTALLLASVAGYVAGGRFL